VPVGFFSSSRALAPVPAKTTRRSVSFRKFPTVPTSDRNKISFDSTRLGQMPLSQNQNRREKQKRSNPILTDLFGAGESRHAAAEPSYSGQLRGSGQSDSQA
jgi:hypothetical protein